MLTEFKSKIRRLYNNTLINPYMSLPTDSLISSHQQSYLWVRSQSEGPLGLGPNAVHANGRSRSVDGIEALHEF